MGWRAGGRWGSGLGDDVHVAVQANRGHGLAKDEQEVGLGGLLGEADLNVQGSARLHPVPAARLQLCHVDGAAHEEVGVAETGQFGRVPNAADPRDEAEVGSRRLARIRRRYGRALQGKT